MTPTRRAVLLGSGATLLAACTRESPAPRPAVVDPDDALRAAAVDRERSLLAAYDALLAGAPGLAARLQPVRAEHEAHLAALVGPPPSGSAAPLPVPPPATAVADLPALVAAERATATAHAAATAEASPELAALLAQLAASEASHPVALA